MFSDVPLTFHQEFTIPSPLVRRIASIYLHSGLTRSYSSVARKSWKLFVM